MAVREDEPHAECVQYAERGTRKRSVARRAALPEKAGTKPKLICATSSATCFLYLNKYRVFKRENDFICVMTVQTKEPQV